MLNGQKLLATTYNMGAIYILSGNGDDKLSVDKIFKCGKRPMGMAISADCKTFAVGLFDTIDFYDADDSGAFTLGKTVEVGRVNIHDMEFDGDGSLIFNNTTASSICKVDREAGTFETIGTPTWITDSEGVDKCHLNGLCLKDKMLGYVTSFSQSDNSAEWKKSDDRLSSGVLVNTTTNGVVLEGLCIPHSPSISNGKLWFCNSGLGNVCCVDEGGSLKVVSEHNGFTRGLAFTDTYAFVGLSTRRSRSGRRANTKTSTLKQMPVWEKNIGGCGIAVISKETGEVVSTAIFGLSGMRNMPNEIFDICLVPSTFDISKE